MYKWPLNDISFTWLDRLKICKFFLTPSNFWTQNKYVQQFERKMADFTSFDYAVFVSSGSAANTILAMYLRDKLKATNSKRNIVVLPSTTWTTSCAPFIREGFEPYFIDVSLENFSIDPEKLKKYTEENHQKIAAIFPTSLLGFNTDYPLLKYLKSEYPEIDIFIDQCENTFGGFDSLEGEQFNMFTSTTSTYMGHELQSVEGGFLFTNSKEEHEQFLMYRNHGMVRSLSSLEGEGEKYKNRKVDYRFDFYSLGSNFRNTDINAFIGLLDYERRLEHVRNRRYLYKEFSSNLNRKRYVLPYNYQGYMDQSQHVPFCLPIICKGEDSEDRLRDVKFYCFERGIETRPIISGFLGYQTAYKQYMNEKDYPNSIYLHNNGIYIGLHSKVKASKIKKLIEYLNRI